MVPDHGFCEDHASTRDHASFNLGSQFWGWGYMREIGTMWQIGILTRNRALFLSKIGHFRRFGTTKIRRDFRRVWT